MSTEGTGLGTQELYDRMFETLAASWAYFADGSPGARVVREEGAAIAVFLHRPDRDIFNNALLGRDGDTAAAIAAIETTYGAAGIDGYAAWAHESDGAAVEQLIARGYVYDTSTRAMAMRLDEIAMPRPVIELADAGYDEFLAINGLPGGLFPDLGPGAHFYIARDQGRNAAAVMAFEHEGDCGIYNVATIPEARRRGLGTALTAHAVHAARDRGCETASLQSTEMAERVYAAVGFRDLGRFDEYVLPR